MSALNITVKTLLADSAVIAIVGQRIYPIYTPQAASFPNIVVHLISEADPDNLGGAPKRPESRVSIEMRTAGDVPTLGQLGPAVINAMQDKTEYAIAGCIATIRKEGTDATDRSDEILASGLPSVIRRIVDFYITWRVA